MALISLRLPAELLQTLDAWAAQSRATRSAVLRALIEDAIDAGEAPTVSPSTSELLAELHAEQDERLRQLTRS